MLRSGLARFPSISIAILAKLLRALSIRTAVRYQIREK
jgi:hypothetical protein